MATLAKPSASRQLPARRQTANLGVILVVVLVLAVFLGLYPFAKGAAILLVAIAGLALVLTLRGRASQTWDGKTNRSTPNAEAPGYPGSASRAAARNNVERRVSVGSIIVGVLGSILAVFGVLAIVTLYMVMSLIIGIGQMCGFFAGPK
jgi:hypothetical protein